MFSHRSRGGCEDIEDMQESEMFSISFMRTICSPFIALPDNIQTEFGFCRWCCLGYTGYLVRSVHLTDNMNRVSITILSTNEYFYKTIRLTWGNFGVCVSGAEPLKIDSLNGSTSCHGNLTQTLLAEKSRRTFSRNTNLHRLLQLTPAIALCGSCIHNSKLPVMHLLKDSLWPINLEHSSIALPYWSDSSIECLEKSVCRTAKPFWCGEDGHFRPSRINEFFANAKSLPDMISPVYPQNDSQVLSFYKIPEIMKTSGMT